MDLSYEATISPDGRYVAFTSTATDLIDPSTGFSDTNASPDVYLRDLDDPTSGATRIVSVSSSGAQGNDGSERPSISSDGRYIAFESFATNLDTATSDTNGNSDVFRHDTTTGATVRVSIASDGTQGNGYNNFASISDNGAIVTWASSSSNFLGHAFGTLVRDMTVASGWSFTVLPGASGQPAISGNGRYIAYPTDAGLVPGDTNGSEDVYRYDRQDSSLDLVSSTTTGQGAGAGGSARAISDDGSIVVFGSASPDVLPAGQDTNGVADVFVWSSSGIVRASVGDDGAQANGASTETALSGDGHVVVFSSSATNLLGRPPTPTAR